MGQAGENPWEVVESHNALVNASLLYDNLHKCYHILNPRKYLLSSEEMAGQQQRRQMVSDGEDIKKSKPKPPAGQQTHLQGMLSMHARHLLRVYSYYALVSPCKVCTPSQWCHLLGRPDCLYAAPRVWPRGCRNTPEAVWACTAEHTLSCVVLLWRTGSTGTPFVATRGWASATTPYTFSSL